jgi:serine/threonine-protein kinase
MVMVYVPVGEFLMGSKDDDPDAKADEKSQHKVYLDAFWVYQTEVTNAMFQTFVGETGYETFVEKKMGVSLVCDFYGPSRPGVGFSIVSGADWQHPLGSSSDIQMMKNNPMGHVSWDDAAAYCQWAVGRLPTEAEWEKAARGTDGRTYPWSEGIDCSFVYYSKEGFCVNEFLPVGSYPKGVYPYGVLDMAGSVWEWVADWYSGEYFTNSPYENPIGPESGRFYVIRGLYGLLRLPCVANRYNDGGLGLGGVSNNLLGFRCAGSP